jgi:hypothetical protein
MSLRVAPRLWTILTLLSRRARGLNALRVGRRQRLVSARDLCEGFRLVLLQASSGLLRYVFVDVHVNVFGGHRFLGSEGELGAGGLDSSSEIHPLVRFRVYDHI